MKIAHECIQRGHTVDLFANSASGEIPDEVRLQCIAVTAQQNYKRNEQFANKVMQNIAEGHYDAVIGFNKMAGLDVYYAADPCYAVKAAARSFFYRLLSRTRSYLAAEQAVFGVDEKTHILLISPAEQKVFSHFYATGSERMHLLPPGIQRDRIAPPDYDSLRDRVRGELGLTAGDILLLMVGSGFKTKGLDRSLRAIASLPLEVRRRVRLMVIGQDKERQFRRLANSLGISEQVLFVGGRDDVSELMFAADILLHPAYRENTGTVLLEAVAAQLPILVTD
ncbi:MAG: glycosyltransferase family 4 protein, partial [Desulfuromonadales bacterium]|nr:glycosyltransferase family 4 protein [Desulfuromonadales bacterium]